MSALEVRQVKRPRMSLSCIVCRQRKVRCGREQPECTNCIRMNKKCLYNSLVRDELTGRIRQPSPGTQDSDLARLDPQKNQTWSQVNPVTRLGDIRPTQSYPNWEDSISTTINRSSDPNQPMPREHQVPLVQVHPKVHTWEEAIQGPVNHDISGSGITPAALSHQELSSQNNQPDMLSPDYISLRRGGRVRYIGKAFWGFVSGQESLSDDFFDENRNAQPGLPLPHIAAADLANILRSLPSEPVCDVLLQAFFVAVWPLAPLVHTTTLLADYAEFWEWCRNSHTAMPPAKIVDNPTFVCLLFAILFCGASAAPAVMWTSASLQTLRKETTVNHLKSAYMASLSMCQHLEHPTFNTLVSTLLTGPFNDRPSEPMHNLLSVGTTVRIAQTMGLHLELTWSALDPVTREMRRRAWWHIVWLDVQSSISTGLPLCCGTDMQDAVSMIFLTRDEEISNLSSASSLPTHLRSGESVAMIYAIGRCETAHLESKIVSRLQSAHGLTHEGFGELVTATKQLHQRLDTLIAKIPSQGIPEKGFIPFRLANASPLTHPSFYKDDTSQPTVFAAWARIMLTLLKFEVAVLLQKPILSSAESEKPQERQLWTSIAQLCLSYLRNYLQLYQTPAFAPYVWSYRTHFGPLQCTFIMMIYLLQFRQASNYQLARYCVDEMIDHFINQYQSADSSSTKDSPESSKPRAPVSIQVLIDLYRRLDSPTGSNEPPPQPVDWKAVASGKAIHGNVPDSGPGQDFLAILPDLQAWSAQLVMESEGFSEVSTR